MKIGILTQPLGHNYGGILQNYALQQVLKGLGHKPLTIKYGVDNARWVHILVTIKIFILRLLGKHINYIKYVKSRPQNPYTIPFVEKYISRTKSIDLFAPHLLYKYGFQCMISGSDQVWRLDYNLGKLKPMYQKFVWGKKCKRIAYAASFGIDYWDYSPKQTEQCAKLAKRFDAISVREKSGITLCKEHLGVEAIEVLDPTLMLPAEHYASLCTDVPFREEKFVAAYVLDLDEKKCVAVEKFSKELGLTLKLFSADKNANLTVEEWLSIFRDASYVITDSFHGTVFSIIHHKPFISIANAERGASRFHSLLEKFGLESRLISDFAELKPLPEIDWASVDAKIAKWQEISKNFLETALCLK